MNLEDWKTSAEKGTGSWRSSVVSDRPWLESINGIFGNQAFLTALKGILIKWKREFKLGEILY